MSSAAIGRHPATFLILVLLAVGAAACLVQPRRLQRFETQAVKIVSVDVPDRRPTLAPALANAQENASPRSAAEVGFLQVADEVMRKDWDGVGSLHERFKSESRDDVWAANLEVDLTEWLRRSATKSDSPAASSMIRCAQTVCEILILPDNRGSANDAGVIYGNLMDDDLQGHLEGQEMDLAAATAGGSKSGRDAVVLYISKQKT